MCSCTFDLLWEVIRYVEQRVRVPVEQGLSVGLLHIKFQDHLPAAIVVASFEEVGHGFIGASNSIGFAA